MPLNNVRFAKTSETRCALSMGKMTDGSIKRRRFAPGQQETCDKCVYLLHYVKPCSKCLHLTS